MDSSFWFVTTHLERFKYCPYQIGRDVGSIGFNGINPKLNLDHAETKCIKLL